MILLSSLHGALAQLGERYTGSVEVSGSIPLCSTKSTVSNQDTVLFHARFLLLINFNSLIFTICSLNSFNFSIVEVPTKTSRHLDIYFSKCYIFIVSKRQVKCVMEKKHPLSNDVIKQLRMCGHFLYFKMGGKIGRRRILVVLEKHHELLQKELQDILEVQSGSLSEIIIKMENDGLIEKAKSEKDGRHLVLRLTEKGLKEAEIARSEHDKNVEELMSCLTENQKEELNNLLSTILSHWKTIEKHLETEPPINS